MKFFRVGKGVKKVGGIIFYLSPKTWVKFFRVGKGVKKFGGIIFFV